MTFGLKYKMGDWTPYAAVRMQGNKNENTGALAEAKQTTYGFGIGRHMKAGDGKVMYNLGYFKKGSLIAAGTTDNTSMIPISVAGEVDLNSWMAVRAGVQYNLVHQKNGVTEADSTSARIGATIKSGGAAIDWVMGSGGATAETSADDVSLGIGQGMFSSVSLTYAW
jgi:predicted porin